MTPADLGYGSAGVALHIGTLQGWAMKSYEEYVDDIRIWRFPFTRYLTIADIQARYAAGRE